MSARYPCPCCGHLTLRRGPGDYELCPVCQWEDDGSQLRWPMSSDGANGVSLMDAQQVHRRFGTLGTLARRSVRRTVRRPRRDEPLDPGWRPFDPTRDWTGPALPGQGWPVDPESLYYWRSTYWNGDPGLLDGTPPRKRSDTEPAAAASAEWERVELERWSQLWNGSRGQPVEVIEEQLHTRQPGLRGQPQAELNVALTARLMSDPNWHYRHPRAALALAWRHRRAQSPLRTLSSMRRRRFAG